MRAGGKGVDGSASRSSGRPIRRHRAAAWSEELHNGRNLLVLAGHRVRRRLGNHVEAIPAGA